MLWFPERDWRPSTPQFPPACERRPAYPLECEAAIRPHRLDANTVSRGNPAILRRPHFLPFVAFLPGDFENEVHRFAGAGASAHDEVGIVDFLLASFVRIRNAEV